MASSSSSAIELPKLTWLEEEQDMTSLGTDDDQSWTDRFWAQPELVRGEATVAASIGVKWRDRGPLGPNEGGPSTWRKQEYREGSGRWGNRGKGSNEKFWGKIRAKRDAKKAKKARTGYSQEVRRDSQDDGHQQGENEGDQEHKVGDDQEDQKEGEREHDDGKKDGDQEHSEHWEDDQCGLGEWIRSAVVYGYQEDGEDWKDSEDIGEDWKD